MDEIWATDFSMHLLQPSRLSTAKTLVLPQMQLQIAIIDQV